MHAYTMDIHLGTHVTTHTKILGDTHTHRMGRGEDRCISADYRSLILFFGFHFHSAVPFAIQKLLGMVSPGSSTSASDPVILVS